MKKEGKLFFLPFVFYFVLPGDFQSASISEISLHRSQISGPQSQPLQH